MDQDVGGSSPSGRTRKDWFQQPNSYAKQTKPICINKTSNVVNYGFSKKALIKTSEYLKKKTLFLK